jgi:hypothetical protein
MIYQNTGIVGKEQVSFSLAILCPSPVATMEDGKSLNRRKNWSL